MSPDLNVGLVGCGRLAERGYVPAIRRLKGIRLAAVADPVASRCHETAPGVRHFQSAAGLVSEGHVDTVILATPASSHLSDARVAVRAGLPVLVEKPPATDAAQAAAIAELGPQPRVGFNRRFDPALQRLRARVPEGELELELHAHHPAARWNSHVVSDDALLSHGSHLIDLVRWLTGCEVEDVRATTLTRSFAALDLAIARGSAAITCATEGPPRNSIDVRVAGGPHLRHDGMSFTGRVMSRLARPVTPSGLVQLLVRELADFARFARGKPAPLLATADDGARAMSVIDAARRSAATGGRRQVTTAASG